MCVIVSISPVLLHYSVYRVFLDITQPLIWGPQIHSLK